MNEWIPITERLPENNRWKQVIVTLELDNGTHRQSRCAYFTGGMFYGCETHFPYAEGTVKAWMPMPEPYERRK